MGDVLVRGVLVGRAHRRIVDQLVGLVTGTRLDDQQVPGTALRSGRYQVGGVDRVVLDAVLVPVRLPVLDVVVLGVLRQVLRGGVGDQGEGHHRDGSGDGDEDGGEGTTLHTDHIERASDALNG